MNVKQRQRIERQILAAFVKSAIEQGYTIDVDNGGDEFELEGCGDAEGVMQACMLTDYDRVHFGKDGKIFGWAFFVYGNDGWDVINDYTANAATEPVIKEANELAERLEKKHAAKA